MSPPVEPADTRPGAASTPLPVDQVRAAIRAAVDCRLGRETVPLRHALGRVLARELVAPFDVPAHDNAAMDGYALRHADLAADRPTALVLAGRALAGHPFDGAVGAGQCVRVMTGAVLPRGADAVVMQEQVTVDGDRVVVPPGARAGQNCRRAGEDLARGHAALGAGRRLRAADLGLIASLGVAEVEVVRRLRVACLSTGDELAAAGATLAAGQVYDANRSTLVAMVERLGLEALDCGLVRDDPLALRSALAQAAAAADVVLTSGGVAAGDADHTRALIGELGSVQAWSVAMRPGRPLAFGRIGEALVFGLPGNPVATMVAFYQFAREALLLAAGCTEPPPPLLPVRSATAIPKRRGRTEYPRGVLGTDASGTCVRALGAQGSGILRSMSAADCLIVLAHDRGDVAAGETVDVQPFDGLA